MKKLTLVTALILLFLGGCTSVPEKGEGSARKAAETNTALGRNYMDRGQYEIALEKLKRAVASDRTYAPAHTLLAILYETIGEIEDAGTEYRLAVRYDPEDGDVNNNYGAFLCGRGKFAEAEKYFVTAVDDPFYQTPAIALANAGSCALQRGDLDNAEIFLRQSLEYDQKLGSALLPMAEVSYRKGAYLRARAFLQRYEALGTMDESSLTLGYQIENRLGDEKAANRYRQELQERYPDADRAGRAARQE
ncbi:MAG: type IV pilus biogenesis/stability protein PilW [Xanthomonadales bacterium]|nr:type IV pilus biogenesis/stability protein PilW [Gammaproteobacteria bacterium]MBT8052709.1 type IV pilus biogenesis/stability protein PilW [Gammaproteobacteria bacterium]NND57371.1 type IV pilus biogenesis/stability protein PilW [Xanthomonadales bacterium]NNK50633.1 type IV pilus biogenesis/stability protein PilW [Xanthomonadales bacterium]